MNRPENSIEKFRWEPYSRVRGKNVTQMREQVINYLVGFYFSSLISALIFVFILGVIQGWEIPAKWGIPKVTKEIATLLSAIIAIKFSYDSIKDVITTKFNAATENLEYDIEDKLSRDMLDDLIVKENVHVKYLACLKQTIGSERLKLQEMSPRLQKEHSEDPSAFGDELDKGFEGNKNNREVRCIVHSFTKTFWKYLAIQGIIEALHLQPNDAIERIRSGNDLYPLRFDVSVYLSAWLVCSIDNDMGITMPIHSIGMTYTRRGQAPDKETYKNVIQAIQKILVDGTYTGPEYYLPNDPLPPESIKIIVNRLDELIDLIKEYVKL